jgi:hypothetical protein
MLKKHLHLPLHNEEYTHFLLDLSLVKKKINNIGPETESCHWAILTAQIGVSECHIRGGGGGKVESWITIVPIFSYNVLHIIKFNGCVTIIEMAVCNAPSLYCPFQILGVLIFLSRESWDIGWVVQSSVIS